jgi:internalin A
VSSQAHKRLRQLSLSNNQLTTVPPLISQLPQLERLSLSGNRIVDLMSLQGCRTLISLSLRHCGIQSLPDSLGAGLPELTSLDLSDNRLTSMTWVRSFAKLRSLFLADNRVEEIPPWIHQLPLLRVLDLSSNCISELWPLRRCTDLRQLYVDGNRISSPPLFFAFHRSLGILWLHDNPLPPELADTNAKAHVARTLQEMARKAQLGIRAAILGTSSSAGAASPLYLHLARSAMYDPCVWAIVKMYLY